MSIERAAEFLEAHPDAALPIAKLLARRLQHATGYLVDLKHQFQGYQDHFGMIDEVLESFTHQQDESFPAGGRAAARRIAMSHGGRSAAAANGRPGGALNGATSAPVREIHQAPGTRGIDHHVGGQRADPGGRR